MTEIVLITGVTGFIGSHLAKELVEKNYEVYGIARYAVSRNKELIKEFLKDVTLLTADITDFHAIQNIFKSINPDYVLHTAALTPVRLSFERPFENIQSNIIGTMNIAHAMLGLSDYETRKLIAASTAEVYGLQKINPIPEDVQLNPTSPYAVSKAAADMYIRMMCHIFGLNAIILRPTNTYGRKFETGFLVEYLITEMLKGNKVYVGAPDSIRDYMYVTDHVEAYKKAMESKISGEVFNVAPGFGITNKELAFKIAELIGFDKNNIVLGSYPPGYPFRPIVSDQPYIVLDSRKIKEKLGWEAKVSLEEGLKKTIEYWKNKL
ncbi:MAG: SDR family NAD(P)-dependent oxidoreductase [Candidatus Aenigmatarchaeota archaeon]